MTPESIRAALGDRQAMLCTLVGEVAGEPVHAQIAVACVIRNRVNADLGSDNKPDWWGEGVKAVCLAKWQFSCWSFLGSSNKPEAENSERVFMLAESLITKTALPPGVDPATAAQLRWIVDGVMTDAVKDNTNGATHYLTTKLLNSEHAPAWAKGKVPCAIVGAHSFFKGVG